MHPTDPAFADTELAGSNISPFPLIGTARTPAPRQRPAVDHATNLMFNFTERVRGAADDEPAQPLQRLDTWEGEATRMAEAYRSGKAYGESEGFRAGFTSGTTWGFFCGAFGTCLLAAIAVVGIVVYVGRRVPLGL